VDPSYTGTWQCSKILACERGIQIAKTNQLNPSADGGRQCVNTFGCAKSEECINPNTGKLYNGETLYVRSMFDGSHLGSPFFSTLGFHHIITFIPFPPSVWPIVAIVVQVNSVLPGGMTVQPFCCDSPTFSNDDAKIVYETVCFSDASALLRRRPLATLAWLAVATLLSLYMLYT